MEMSEKKRNVKHLDGSPLRDLPAKKLVGRQKVISPGVIGTVFEEVDVAPLPIITGAKAPIRDDIQETVRSTPTKPTLTNHRAIEDPTMWGKFAEVGTPTIVGGQIPRRTLPREPGRPDTGPVVIATATRSETLSEAGLLRRTLERLLGEKKK